jgi:hypothetical protein
MNTRLHEPTTTVDPVVRGILIVTGVITIVGVLGLVPAGATRPLERAGFR